MICDLSNSTQVLFVMGIGITYVTLMSLSKLVFYVPLGLRNVKGSSQDFYCDTSLNYVKYKSGHVC